MVEPSWITSCFFVVRRTSSDAFDMVVSEASPRSMPAFDTIPMRKPSAGL